MGFSFLPPLPYSPFLHLDSHSCLNGFDVLAPSPSFLLSLPYADQPSYFPIFLYACEYVGGTHVSKNSGHGIGE